MLSNLDPASELFLADVARVQQRLAEANRQASSGKKVAAPSDAPAEIDTLLQLRADQQQNAQIQSNLALAKTDADAADSALTAAVKLMDRALVLAGQSAGTTQTAQTRLDIAQEIEAIQQQMVSYSRTSVGGRYIFSGDSDAGPAYRLDLTSPGGVTHLSAAQATRQVQDPAGGSFPASQTAQEIFDSHNPDGTPAADNVFAALDGLRLALLNNDEAATTAAIDSIKQAAARLNSSQAFYGAVENRIQAGADFAAAYDVQLKTGIGHIEDADMTSAALELTQATTQLQAAFQMRAHMPHTSLFDFLG